MTAIKLLPSLARMVIRVNGSIEPLPNPLSITAVEEAIGADMLDTVNLRDAAGHVMLVDDIGHFKKLPVNEVATSLYWSACKPGTSHMIRGDVVIAPDADFGSRA